MLYRMDEEVVCMNRVYKVIFNRRRQLVQVVPEYARNRGKTVSESRKGGIRGLAKVLLTFLVTLIIASPGYAADGTGESTGSGNTTYISDSASEKENIQALDEQVVKNAQDIAANKTSIDTNTANITTNKTAIAANKTAIEKNTADIATNTANISENQTAIAANKKAIADNKTAIDKNKTDISTNKTAIADNKSNITANTTAISEDKKSIATNESNIAANASAITSLKDLSNVSDAGKTVIKKQAKQAVKVVATGNATVTTTGSADDGSTLTYTINVAHDGEIKTDDTNLVSGGTMYAELRPASDGIYVKSGSTTATNLLALDTNLKNVIDAIGLDTDDTTTSYTSKLNKYFKVNPKETTSDDGKTKTYAPDAAANGTNSVAIGPSAQAGEKTTDATTSTATVIGGESSAAIGDSAKANGDQSVALGYKSQVLNASGSTTAVSGSTAIGNGAKVEGGSDSTALGTGATVDTASNAMALGMSATINKTATSGVAIGNGAVTGSADTTKVVDNVTYNVKAAGGKESVAIGTSASSAGNTSIALGKGAAIENDTDGNYQAVVKSDDIAIGTGAKTSASDSSTAIGKSATVSQSTDAMAIGSGAKVTTANNAMALGKDATADSAADSIAMGTKAKTISADTIAIGQSTSAEGANSVVIGKNAMTTLEGGNAIGTGSAASGNSTAIGQSATANNYNAVAIGNGATANADKSIALGYNAGVGTSEGRGETQNAGSLIAIGTSSGNNVSGMQNVAIGEGAGSNVKSSYNIAIGTQAGYGINYASDNKSQNGFNVSIGYKANYQENSADIMYATALGNESNASNYAVAIGDKAKASGSYSVALGDTAQASDAESIALGHNTNAADGNIAIGNGSLAPAISTLGTVKAVTVDGNTVNYVYASSDATEPLKSAFTYKPLSAEPNYISIGNSTLTRRISNVADGVFDTDAATVGQLNSLNELLQATDTKVGLTKDYFEEKFTNLNTTVDASKTHYFSISESSDNLSANKDNTGATSNMADAMAIGPNANATNIKSLAVGNNVYATGLRSIAIGTAPNPTTDSAGTTTTHNTSADGENSIALGTSTTAQAANSIAIGTRAQTYTTDTTGNTGVSSVAIGNFATTAGNQSVALGYEATVKYNYGTAIGADALASGDDAVAIGKGSKAYSTDSTAIGQNNSITGNNVYGLGSSNEMKGKWGAVTQSGVSGYKNTVTSVSDQDTTNVLTDVYMTGNNNELNQNVQYNVMQDITLQGNSNTIDGGAGGTSSHQNTLSQIAIVGSGNTVQGKSSGSDDGKTNNIKDVTILGYNNKVDANTDTTVDFSNTQILGNNVTATLGNSVYLGNNAAYVQPTSPVQNAIDAAKTKADTAAEASDEYKAATTDEDKATIKAQYEAKYLYKLRVQAMEGKGTTAGMNSYDTDETYDNGTSYTYAGSNPAGVVTVGTAGSERRIQNVAAGLVSATSTDAVNGSQLYALTRQLRFGGDNSTFGKTTAAEDQNVVARGSNEALSIIGGETDTTKLTDNNIGVVADRTNNTLTVKLASDLKKLNTASLGSGSGDSYKETIKLDGTNGKVTVADSSGAVKTTLDTAGLTLSNGAKFTSSGIDAASQKIASVKAGEDDTDAANVGQVNAAAAEATTEVKAGTNASLGTVETSAADKHKIYTVNVDNLAVKANGTGTTTVALAKGINFKNGTNTTSAVDSNGNVTIDTKNLALKANGTNTATVTMDNGINFKNGTNTTATVGADGTVTISATHNKLSTVSAATGDNDNVTLTLTDADGNTVTSTGLKNTYTTVTKDGTAHTVTFARNDGTTQIVSLGDLDGASTEALNKAAAKATSEVTNGTNVASVTKTAGTNGQNIYTVNVDDLAVKTTSGEKKSVHLADGIVFADGTNTTATVGDNGTIKYNVSDAAIKKQAVQAVNVTGGSNVTVNPVKNTDGTLETFTISATHNALKSAKLTKGTNDVSTLTITGNDGDSASVDIKNTYLTVNKDPKAKTVTFTSNDGTTPATTLSLSDFGAASTTDMTAAVAKATTEVRAGANTSLGTVETDTTDQHKIYTVNVDNLGVSQNGTKVGTGVSLKNGLNFTDGTNTTASVAENGTVSYSVSNDAIKAQAKNAVMVAAGDNVSIDVPTDVNNVKTYTVKVNNLQLQADGVNKATRKLADGINFAGGTNTTADVTADGKVTYDLKDSISLNQVQTGDSTLTTNGLTITNGPTFTKNKIDANNQQITNVASGGDVATNAATIGDLKKAIETASAGTTASGFKTKGNYGEAVTSRLDKQLNVIGDVDTTKVAQKNLADGNVGVVTSTDNDGNATLTVKLNKDINLGESGSVTTGSTIMNNTGITNGNMSLGADGITIQNGPKFTNNGIDAANQKITGVDDGIEDKDAVNVSQLKKLQKQVSNSKWTLAGKDVSGTAVDEAISDGKKVTFGDGQYTKSVVGKDKDGNATVKVDVTTGTLTAGADGKISSTDGLATTGAVENAVNNASWTIQDGNNTGNAQQVKAGDTVSLKAGDNLSLDQSGKEFTYKLNKTLTGMTSVTAVDDKQNTAVLNGEGLKVSDKEGDSLTQHATEIRLHDGTKEATDTATDVVLNKQGLQNGGHTITGVADGTIGENSQDAINGSQFYKLQQTVTNGGWNITGEDTNNSTHIGNDKTVSFKNGAKTTVEVTGSDTGAVVKVNVNTTAIKTDADHKATATGDGLATASDVANTINAVAWNVKKNGGTVQQVKAGDTVTFDAGDNIVLNQTGTSFTYGLASDVNTNSIRLGGSKDTNGNWTGGIFIGKQIGGGANQNEGNYITGLNNTSWDLAKVVDNRAATEAQLKEAINQITLKEQNGGFALSGETGSDKVSQTLGNSIAIVGDTQYESDGKTVKTQGNITTEADSTNVGGIKIKLNKNINLSNEGSVTIGSSSLSNGRAQVGNVVVNGSDNTVSGLSNTKWDEATAKADGYKSSTKAATESQLQAVYDQATNTASANEQHIKAGTYDINTTTDHNGNKKNSVTMNIVDGSGNNKGTVVINNVAKASDVGDTDELAADIKNQNGGQSQPTSVVEAINNLNDKVGDKNYSKVQGKEIADGDNTTTAIGKLNNRMNDIYQTAGQHTTVSNTDKNLEIKPTTDDKGKTNYEINLSKQVNLGDVKLDGDKGSIEAKSVKADSFTSGSTVVNNDGVQVGKGTALTSDSLKVGNKTYISSDGLNANSQKITNVQAGTADTDAANVGQVRAADEQLAGGIEQNARNINQLSRDVDKLDSRIDRVGAGAAALAALHPGAYDPNDKVDFSAGYGNYRGASAAAVGMYYHPDERTILSMGVAMGGGENMVNAGVTWKLGRRTPVTPQPVPVKAAPAAPALGAVSTAAAAPVRPAETAPVVKPAVVQTAVRPVETAAPVAPAPVRLVQPAPALQPAPVKPADSNAQLMDLLARQTAILEKLAEQKSAPVAAPKVSGDDLFTDVPENHWAYACALKLEQAGALKGLNGLQVAGNPLLTRKDFAKILYTALKNGATTNPALNQDGSLNRMASEFRAELKEVKG